MVNRWTAAISDRRVLFLASTGTMDEMSERIWGRGGLSNGGTIKYEENYEVYIYKPPFPRAPNGKGKTGKKIKGQWAPTYIAAKASQDRGDLPFELTGELRQAWLGGTVPTPREKNPLLCVIDLPQKEAEKAEGLAKQKGEFLELTDEEIESHERRIFDLVTEILNAP
jgi:hypothetical protein